MQHERVNNPSYNVRYKEGYVDRSAEWCKIIQKIKDIKDSQTCGT